jgi:hypothetical protein
MFVTGTKLHEWWVAFKQYENGQGDPDPWELLFFGFVNGVHDSLERTYVCATCGTNGGGEPFIIGIHPFTHPKGDRKLKEPLHPSRDGQAEYADAFSDFLLRITVQGTYGYHGPLPKNPPPVSAPATHGPPYATLGDLQVVALTPHPCVSDGTFAVSETIRVSGTGFGANETVALVLEHSAGSTALPAAQADATGALSATVVIPPGTPVDAAAVLRANSPLGATGGGTSLTSAQMLIKASLTSDADGDGLYDQCDNCPSASNVSQADGDADGVGDSCDACPQDTENDIDGDGVCGDIDTNDFDGDGIRNAQDNCPFTANADQADQGGVGASILPDGIGDACQ